MSKYARLNDTAQPVSKVCVTDRTLVIGNLARWNAEGRMAAPPDHVHFANFDLLTSELLLQIDPNLVLSPLFGDNFDVIDVAKRLAQLRYVGRYRAISTNVPDIDMIRREVRAQSTGLDFDLLALLPDDAKIS